MEDEEDDYEDLEGDLEDEEDDDEEHFTSHLDEEEEDDDEDSMQMPFSISRGHGRQSEMNGFDEE